MKFRSTLTLLLLVGLTTPTWAQGARPLNSADVTLSGAAIGPEARLFTAGVGDVNGDGIEDLIVGAPAQGPSSTGAAYLVLGSTELTGNIDLSSNAIQILGLEIEDQLGATVAELGDLNDDGYDDFAIAAPRATFAERNNAGEVCVLFGRETFPAAIDLSALDGTDGLTIGGAEPGDRIGESLSRAGDFNGDGIEDLAIGSPRRDPLGRERAGEVYVLFGRTNFTASVDLLSVNSSDGVAIIGQEIDQLFGSSVSEAGDFNGDGLDDLVIGAETTNPGISEAGSAWVIYGINGISGTFDIASPPSADALLRVNGNANGGFLGHAVEGVGDLNDDGLDDVFIGAPFAGPSGEGEGVILFGHAVEGGVFAVEALGSRGVVIRGASPGDEAGFSAYGLDDINGDNIADLVIGAPGAGAAYLFFGAANFPSLISLSTDYDGIFDGPLTLGGSGSSASTARAGDVVDGVDLNGDTSPDVVIGVPGENEVLVFLGASPLSNVSDFEANLTAGDTVSLTWTPTTDLQEIEAYRELILGLGPQSLWTFEEESGTDVADRAGNYPGVYRDGVTLGVEGALPGTTTATAGVDGTFEVETPSGLQITGDLTIAFWMNTSEFVGNMVTLTGILSPDEYNTLYRLEWVNPRRLFYKHEFAGGLDVELNLTWDTDLEADTWYHIALVRDVSEGTIEIFVDGVSRSSATYDPAESPVGGSLGDLYVGSHAGISVFPGRLDEMAIFARELSDASVAQLSDVLPNELVLLQNGSELAVLDSEISEYEVRFLEPGLQEFCIFRRDSLGLQSSQVCSTVEVSEGVSFANCVATSTGVAIDWSNPFTYDSIEIRRNDVTIATLSGDASSYLDTAPLTGEVAYSIVAVNGGLELPPVGCLVAVPAPPADLICVTSGCVVDLFWSVGGYDSVQIFRDGTPIATIGAGVNSYTDPLEVAGSYDYQLIGVIGSGSSLPTTCSVSCDAPIISGPPTSQVVCEGSPVQFSVVASNGPLAYQWRRNGFNLAGENFPTLTIDAATAGDEGVYDVVVSNPEASIVSAGAVLSVVDSLAILAQPVSTLTCLGDDVLLSVTVTSPADASYTWRKDGVAIAVSDSAQLLIENVTFSDSGAYDVFVTSPCGSVTSAVAVVSVETQPTLLGAPVATEVCEGEPLVLTVSVDSAFTLRYQWLRDGLALADQTQPNLIIDAVTLADAGAYSVAVTNDCGTIVTAPVDVTVLDGLEIVAPPSNTFVEEGLTAVLSVIAVGEQLTYQWRRDGVDLPGENGATLVILGADIEDEAFYDVRVSSACGSEVSEEVFLLLGLESEIPRFVRGDTNLDLRLDVSDITTTLAFLFAGRSEPECMDSADTNDDGALNLSDAIFCINFLFGGGAEPTAPGVSTCGVDPDGDRDGMGCATPPEACN